ncbi:DUF3097 domain-containing protein [Saccharopolyspora sp. CA-218241]|uniref:DUF3097 domain-containing protein n=1 Tax=Saccharopolyspora sp. CA-218241 TaxID=3240027 RepID=UPI003D98D948
MRSMDYGEDVLAGPRRRRVPEITAEEGLVVEDPASGFCGAVVRIDKDAVVLEDRHGAQRLFPLRPAGFLFEGRPATLVRPAAPAASEGTRRSASGSVRVADVRARTARGSRIWVEGVHDAELVERVWGHDLRVEGVVVEPLHGIDDLAGALAEFGPEPGRRVGVLVDHLVAGSKEARLVEAVDDEHVLVTGHPFVDIWEAVRPEVVGIREWPRVPRGTEWKRGVCAELGWGEPADGWRRVLSGVSSFRELRTPLLTAVEQLIDFVTVDVTR